MVPFPNLIECVVSRYTALCTCTVVTKEILCVMKLPTDLRVEQMTAVDPSNSKTTLRKANAWEGSQRLRGGISGVLFQTHATRVEVYGLCAG